MSGRPANLRPTRLSATGAILLSLSVVAILAPSNVLPLLGLEAIGLGLLVLGGTALHRGWRLPGAGFALAGGGIVVAAVALIWPITADLFAVLQFGFGMVGAAFVTVGVIPIGRDHARAMVKLGTALVFVSVLSVGVVRRPSLWVLLGTGVMTVLSWDLGENAISLGSQLGRRASTARAEGVHFMGAALVGSVAIGAGQVAVGFGSPGMPIGAFGILLLALLLLAGALHG